MKRLPHVEKTSKRTLGFGQAAAMHKYVTNFFNLPARSVLIPERLAPLGACGPSLRVALELVDWLGCKDFVWINPDNMP